MYKAKLEKSAVVILSISVLLLLLAIWLDMVFLQVTLSILSGAGFLSVLINFLFNEISNSLSHSRNLEIQARNLTLQSDLSYDILKKYIEFSEKYINEVFEVQDLLIKEGPSEIAFQLGMRLRNIRYEYYIYVPDEVESELSKFEFNLRQIGAKAGLAKNLADKERRANAFDSLYELFDNMINLESEDRKTKFDEIARMIKSELAITEITRVYKETFKT